MTKEKRTSKEIAAEVERLTEMKPNVLRRSMFGDDHHKAIDAQVRVLERGMTQDSAANYFDPSDGGENIYSAAMDACFWRDGESDDLPSEAWKDLVR